jgi:magnesium chelatase subunit D
VTVADQVSERVDPGALAASAAALLAVAPRALGGALIRCTAHEDGASWLQTFAALLPDGTPVLRLPVGVTDDRLIGGLDLGATLSAGRPVAEPGILARADGGVVVIPGAERLAPRVVAAIASAMDVGMIPLQRDGISALLDARVALVAFDDGVEDEVVAAPLRERVSCWLALPARWRGDSWPLPTRAEIVAARARVSQVEDADGRAAEVLTATAAILGIDSLRAPVQALAAARAAAALGGRTVISDDDIALAAQISLAPRATRLPPREDDTPPPPPPPDDTPPDAPDDTSSDAGEETRPLEDKVLDAVMASLPPELLDALAQSADRMTQESGRTGLEKAGTQRGRPVGTRRGLPRGGARLHVLETLRAAAPWQRLRPLPPSGASIAVRKEDFRVRRFIERAGRTVIVAVDASGSAALNRLAEAKGAVELLLAESYARRDKVALVAFRGLAAEVLLAPTRALARARRELAALPGGGGTPLASGITASLQLAEQSRRAGSVPTIVILTDGRANIAQDGSPGRPQAEADARASARQVRVRGVAALIVDCSPRGEPLAREIGTLMGGTYVALPIADARTVATVTRAIVEQTS